MVIIILHFSNISTHLYEINRKLRFLWIWQLLDNMQVTVENVHFRYTDQKADPEVLK